MLNPQILTLLNTTADKFQTIGLIQDHDGTTLIDGKIVEQVLRAAVLEIGKYRDVIRSFADAARIIDGQSNFRHNQVT